jgi:2-dehydro-3-deoxyphosphogluconate aldolase/(4S)-4-hydroxy-2-oxoglutarate aldolase
MLNRKSILQRIIDAGAIGIVRAKVTTDLLKTVAALASGGLKVLEITMTSPGALHAIGSIRAQLPDVLIGAGTVLGEHDAKRAVEAGAFFLVSPSIDVEVIEVAKASDAVSIPGALTPTEVVTAWGSGADLVKVFPAEAVGAAYIRALRGPLPKIPLAPTGGITAENAAEYLAAGATIVCAGGWLVPAAAMANEDYNLIATRASDLCASIRGYRERRSA